MREKDTVTSAIEADEIAATATDTAANLSFEMILVFMMRFLSL